jgi:hypothetical protein
LTTKDKTPVSLIIAFSSNSKSLYKLKKWGVDPAPFFQFSFMHTLSVIGLKTKIYKEEPVWIYESSIFLGFPEDKIEFLEKGEPNSFAGGRS